MIVGDHKNVWEDEGHSFCRDCDADWYTKSNFPPLGCTKLSRYHLSKTEVESILCQHIGCSHSQTTFTGTSSVSMSCK